jgi:hypothetical protein
MGREEGGETKFIPVVGVVRVTGGSMQAIVRRLSVLSQETGLPNPSSDTGMSDRVHVNHDFSSFDRSAGISRSWRKRAKARTTNQSSRLLGKIQNLN